MSKYFTSAALLASGLAWSSAFGQGTFIYDQQSADETVTSEASAIIQSTQPIGQSFTPALSSISFIRLQMFDGIPGNGTGAVVYVNLRSDSITGPILGSTDPVSLPDGYGFGTGNRGYRNFFLSNSVSLTPGTMYYLQPEIQAGDPWGVIGDRHFGYSGGTAFVLGVASPDSDLWFREGQFVPEPSSALLLLCGVGVFAWYRHRKRAGG